MLMPTPPTHGAAVAVFSAARPEAHLANGSLSPSQAGRPALTVPWLIQADAWQKPTRCCKAIILQLTISQLES